MLLRRGAQSCCCVTGRSRRLAVPPVLRTRPGAAYQYQISRAHALAMQRAFLSTSPPPPAPQGNGKTAGGSEADEAKAPPPPIAEEAGQQKQLQEEKEEKEHLPLFSSPSQVRDACCWCLSRALFVLGGAHSSFHSHIHATYCASASSGC